MFEIYTQRVHPVLIEGPHDGKPNPAAVVDLQYPYVIKMRDPEPLSAVAEGCPSESWYYRYDILNVEAGEVVYAYAYGGTKAEHVERVVKMGA